TFQNEVLNFAAGDGTPRFNPFFIPKMIADIAPGNISIKHGFMGPNYTTVSACASSANAIIDALNTIRLGYCDVIVTGGSEAAVTIAGMGGFGAMHALPHVMKALKRHPDRLMPLGTVLSLAKERERSSLRNMSMPRPGGQKYMPRLPGADSPVMPII